jgi:hypothetical protein
MRYVDALLKDFHILVAILFPLMVASGQFETVFGAYPLLSKITLSILGIIAWFGAFEILTSPPHLKDSVLKKLVIFSLTILLISSY